MLMAVLMTYCRYLTTKAKGKLFILIFPIFSERNRAALKFRWPKEDRDTFENMGLNN